MTVLAPRRLDRAEHARVAAPARLEAEVHADLAAAEPLWRRMEAGPGRLATPYQRFDWVAAFARHALGADEALRVVVLRDAGGRARLLLPLVLARAGGLTIARGVGGAHANFHLPLFGPEAAGLDPASVRAGLVRAGRRAGLDLYHLKHQPLAWAGIANPLAAGAEPAPSDAYGLALGPDPEATLRQALSGDARKKLRSKERRLVEALGPVRCARAETPEERARFLDAFLAQKAARFAAMGLPDPYAAPPLRRFLAQAAETGAVEIHALTCAGDGRVLATFTGAVDPERYSGMTTSFEADPEVARFSPGDLLLQHLVRDQAARGRRALDLGVGEARYKASLCDETIRLGEALIPVSLRGRAAAGVMRRMIRLKRRIKRDPRLAGLLERLRRRGA